MYLPSPWAQPARGLAALAAFWDAEREPRRARTAVDSVAVKTFTMAADVVAVEGDVGVARAEVNYRTGVPDSVSARG